MKIALLTAALYGDNSGDAIIESAIRRLIGAESFHRFPLTRPLSDDDLRGINACDAAVICGTNLYQSIFACRLDVDTVARIRIPIVPFGIGSSAPIGEIPRMDRAGVAAVRAIHDKCPVSSVRDEASLRFLHSIGVTNVILTGCPVFFHGLCCPDFTPQPGNHSLTPRARLLHIDSAWEQRQTETLEHLARRYRPDIVVQSPYDLPIAEELSGKYGLQIVMDPEWQAERYVAAASTQAVNVGFRLHFGMLSLAYGKPAFMVAHDSRVSEFCRLVGLPLLDIRNYSDSLLTLQIDARSFNSDGIRRSWDKLSLRMQRFMEANGLLSRLEVSHPPAPAPEIRSAIPRILMLVDRRDWAFDHSARRIAAALRDRFRFDIKYVRETPEIKASDYDLLYVFFWGEEYYQRFGFAPEQVIKEVSSHRWEDDPRYGPCTPADFVEKYLGDCGSVICTSARLTEALGALRAHVYHTPNGFDPALFRPTGTRSGPLTIGWAGNRGDEVKGYVDILAPACEGSFQMVTAPGDLPYPEMNGFYNGIDVLAVASRHEGEPLTLIEAMAAGCFPVCCDVGIVPEVVRDRENGYIVRERTPQAFAAAFKWCEQNLDLVRSAGQANAALMLRERRWEVSANFFKRVFWDSYARSFRLRFRNDDVSWDTSLSDFRKFCGIFHGYGQTQVHGIVLNGCTNTRYRFGATPAEYEGQDTLARLDNTTIRKLSRGMELSERQDLVGYLNSIPDELALHGLYHVDFSAMSLSEQKKDLEQGLEAMGRLFPKKRVRYFIPPFNRVSEQTAVACHSLGLEVLSLDGVHLEAELRSLTLKPSTWYRYHHHRFYPESSFGYYPLSLEALEAMLKRNIPVQTRDMKLFPPEPEGNLLERIAARMRGLRPEEE